MTDARQAWKNNLAVSVKVGHPDIKSTLCSQCRAAQEHYYRTTNSGYQMLPYVTPTPETCEVCGVEGATRYLAYWFDDHA